jgi:hypothetical protein
LDITNVKICKGEHWWIHRRDTGGWAWAGPWPPIISLEEAFVEAIKFLTSELVRHCEMREYRDKQAVSSGRCCWGSRVNCPTGACPKTPCEVTL